MITSQIALVYATYLVGAASPGPSNMAIMGTAMRDGRLPALVLAAGVITGSFFWAILAATGLSAVLTTYAEALLVIRIVGGAYLLYLAFQTGRSALKPGPDVAMTDPQRQPPGLGRLYRRGLLMHIGNPKAVLSWMAVMSLGLGQDASGAILPVIIAGCAFLGVIVFGGYGILFSTAPMIALYTRLRRRIEATFSALFALAGFKLLLSRY